MGFFGVDIDEPDLILAPEPIASARARRYVAERLTELGYPGDPADLLLAVSELVTNATLHSRTEIRVRVVRSASGLPRVEVQDRSPTLPHFEQATPTATLGRGLALVATLGTWGVEPVGPGFRSGKVVWFEPGEPGAGHPLTAEPRSERTGAAVAGSGDAGAVLGRYGPTEGSTALVQVQLLRFPLELFRLARIHHDELMRELALIAAAPPGSRGTLSAELQELLGTLVARPPDRDRSDPVRDAAMERGDATVDLVYRLPPSAGTAMRQLTAQLDRAEELCRTGELLTLPQHPTLQEFRRWFAEEIEDQLAGKPPTPWGGPLELDDEPPGGLRG